MLDGGTDPHGMGHMGIARYACRPIENCDDCDAAKVIVIASDEALCQIILDTC